jgi:DNA replication protein DnaC
MTYRHDRKLTARLRYARLRHQAAVEDVDYRATSGLDRALFQKLAEGRWIDAHDNVILSGPTGVGKSWLACALGHRACRNDPFSISAFPSSSPISRWHAATHSLWPENKKLEIPWIPTRALHRKSPVNPPSPRCLVATGPIGALLKLNRDERRG